MDALSSRFIAAPIDLSSPEDQVILQLYGTGIRSRSSLAAVSASIGSIPCEVLYAGPWAEFPGVDQVNVKIDRALASRGEVDLVLRIDGRVTNTLRVSIR
jgi:uncharacterized protein (TIGR03437 family)